VLLSMGAGLSYQCCTSRQKGKVVLLCKDSGRIAGKADVISGRTDGGRMLVCDAVEVAHATLSRSNGGAHASQNAECRVRQPSRADRSAEIVSPLATAAMCSTEIAQRPGAASTNAANASTNAIAGEESGSQDLVRVKSVGGCDAEAMLPAMPNCTSSKHWYSSLEGSGCNNSSISTNAEDTVPGPIANRSLSNWYVGNADTEVAPPPPTNTIICPLLEQEPCHCYDLSSFIKETATRNGDGCLGSFRLQHG